MLTTVVLKILSKIRKRNWGSPCSRGWRTLCGTPRASRLSSVIPRENFGRWSSSSASSTSCKTTTSARSWSTPTNLSCMIPTPYRPSTPSSTARGSGTSSTGPSLKTCSDHFLAPPRRSWLKEHDCWIVLSVGDQWHDKFWFSGDCS
ncbi:hypothetical protein VPH35_072528 [Triticum aestivum]